MSGVGNARHYKEEEIIMMPVKRFKNAVLQPGMIVVQPKAKVCYNCEHFRGYYTPNMGNIEVWFDTCEGKCVAKDKRCTPLSRCKGFEVLRPR